MRKTFSKVTALILSVMMFLSAVPTFAIAASTAHKEGVTLTTDTAFSQELTTQLQSDANLTKRATWAGAAEFSTGKKYMQGLKEAILRHLL